MRSSGPTEAAIAALRREAKEAIGLYGVSAYSVAQRTGEIGLRMALGARRGDGVGLVVGQAARLMLAGLGGGALFARSVEAMLFSVSPADPGVYAAAAGCAVLDALAASAILALRASRVDPVWALRHERTEAWSEARGGRGPARACRESAMAQGCGSLAEVIG